MAGGREVAVSDLTEDGACGNCFCVVPLQLQHEVRHTEAMIRCEGCGVILTPPSDVPEPEEAPEPEVDTAAAGDAADEGDPAPAAGEDPEGEISEESGDEEE